jgi:DNA-directed RNA polymerase alpha subunit
MVANGPFACPTKDSLHNLDIPEGIIEILERANVKSITALCQCPAEVIYKVPGLGPKKMMLLKKALAQHGLSLAART